MEKTTLADMPALVCGEGKPLIFLHGFMSSKEAFIPEVKFFSQYFKAVSVDLKGFGENADMRYPYTLGNYVNDLKRLAEVLGSDKINVVAHSFGCRIALKCAETCDFIDKMVLCGAAGLKPKRTLKYYANKLSYRALKPFFPKSYLEKKFFSPDYNACGEVLKESFKKTVGEYLDDGLCKISASTLAVFGSCDRETPPYLGERLKENINDCSLYIMDGCGHFCFAERPSEFICVVKEFLL